MDESLPTLYTQTGCNDSRKVRDWLTSRGIAFDERNVMEDADAARALIATGMFVTPMLVVGDRRTIGFDPVKLAAGFSQLR